MFRIDNLFDQIATELTGEVLGGYWDLVGMLTLLRHRDTISSSPKKQFIKCYLSSLTK